MLALKWKIRNTPLEIKLSRLDCTGAKLFSECCTPRYTPHLSKVEYEHGLRAPGAYSQTKGRLNKKRVLVSAVFATAQSLTQ